MLSPGNVAQVLPGPASSPAVTLAPSSVQSGHSTGLRLIHLIGIVVLLTGISIGVKFAIDRNLISEVARIGLAYAAGLILLALSLVLRTNYRFLSAILFSGSMACGYFTTYGAMAYYQLLPIPAAFAIMCLLTVVTVVRSFYYDRVEIAVIGLVGAYAIPFLLSQKNGRVDLMLTYIFLINIGVMYLAQRKRWLALSGIAIVVTWLMIAGVYSFTGTTQPSWKMIVFACLFHLLFMVGDWMKSIPSLTGRSHGSGIREEGSTAAVADRRLRTVVMLFFNLLMPYLALQLLFDVRVEAGRLLTLVTAGYAMAVCIVLAVRRESDPILLRFFSTAALILVMY